ncbi:hypothetical protein GALMADRAFT_268911 [Galerina marginata CBS 339.88]|uniref:Glycosyltransferase 61 catalytic domain-containing protein n=1 Tax=Galerina marginata (strain CBS 339.88) TaxID=685588 RepID=A0A067SZ74_GALM3|nr:hypothetical protein GALMADRAFT_268911 [Galerina marginata CBS 339.88]
MLLQQGLTRRDGLLILMGASLVYIFSSLLYYAPPFHNLVANTNHHTAQEQWSTPLPITPQPLTTSPKLLQLDLGVSKDIPETSLVAHAPGWTLFQNLYMSNGTLYIVASELNNATFPEIRMMTSTGLLAENSPENIAMREPTDREMQTITPQVAALKWGGNDADNSRNRIWSIEGNTLLVNEPWQFLNHYYHFVAELLLGTWAFLYGSFNPSSNLIKLEVPASSVSTVPSFNLRPSAYSPPPLSRVIFLHASSEGWRDKPGFNSYFLRAAFPSLTVEVSNDWNDRVNSTFMPLPAAQAQQRAWHFPVALLSDRSAAFRGEACGTKTQRIAAESWEFMIQKGGIDVFGGWWNGVREAVIRFAGVEITNDEIAQLPLPGDEGVGDPQSLLPRPQKIIITYINRQAVRRHLIPEHHDALVLALQQLVDRKRAEDGKEWVFRIVQPELLSKEQQVQMAAETTIMLGVHGNGLTHLVLMKPNRYSSIIEIFYPRGFAHDYEWTTRALGMRHFSVWNDTYFTYPDEPPLPSYPEGFQGTSIPVHGATVAKLIEDRLEGRLQL